MRKDSPPSRVLPQAARDKLIAATRTGSPFTLRREIAINKAIDEVRAEYPSFFNKEQRNETDS
jgi:hypothetical protein